MATAPHTLASLSDISKNVADWVAQVRELTQPDQVHWCDGSQLEFRRLRGELTARGELRELNRTHSRLLPGALGSQGCRARRASDLHLHALARGCGPEQPLDGPNRGPCADAGAVSRLHEGTHALRGALLHGSAGFAIRALRRRDHRQRLRGTEHGDHDAYGPGGARAHRHRGQLRARAALDRRSQPRPAFHHALS